MVAGRRDGAGASFDQCLVFLGVGPSMTIKPQRNHRVILSPREYLDKCCNLGFWPSCWPLISIWRRNTKALPKRHHLVTVWPKVVEFKNIA